MKKIFYIALGFLSLAFNHVEAIPARSLSEEPLTTILTRHLNQPITLENALEIRRILAQRILADDRVITPYLERKRQGLSSAPYNCVTWRIVELNEWGTTTNHLFDLALICKRLQLPGIAQRAGEMAIAKSTNSLCLAAMSEDFCKANLKQLSSHAARKAVEQMKDTQDRTLAYQAANTLLCIQENDLAAEMFGYCPYQEMYWQTIFDIYKKLKEIKHETKAKQAFDRLLKSVREELKKTNNREERKKTNNFFYLLYIAQHCGEEGYYQDCKIALNQAIEEETDVNRLWSCVEFAHFYTFDNLKRRSANKLIERLREYPHWATFERFKTFYPALLKMEEDKAASDLYKIVMKMFTSLSSFKQLVEFITFLGERKECSELMDDTLQHATKLCKPQDTTSFEISLWAFVPPSSCLLVISKLSQKYGRPELAFQTADQAIACAFAESYEDLGESYEEPPSLLRGLEGLKRSLKILQHRTLVKKVSYYQAEIENPTFNTFPPSNPELFDVYWLGFDKEAQGAEIKKKRPWVVITKPRSYGMRSMVTIAPLSSQRHGQITSVPVNFDNMEGEARLDQIRAVDTTRLSEMLGKLPAQYHAQLLLAYKNLVGR